jgi:hypothetical protein
MPVPSLPKLGAPPAPPPLRKIGLEEHFGHPKRRSKICGLEVGVSSQNLRFIRMHGLPLMTAGDRITPGRNRCEYDSHGREIKADLMPLDPRFRLLRQDRSRRE